MMRAGGTLRELNHGRIMASQANLARISRCYLIVIIGH